MRHKKKQKNPMELRNLRETIFEFHSKPCKLESLYMVNNILVQDLKKK